MPSIWKHSPTTQHLLDFKSECDVCPYCRAGLTPLSYIGDQILSPNGWSSDVLGQYCARCGWWLLQIYRIAYQGSEAISHDPYATYIHRRHYAHATLVEFDLAQVTVELEAVRNYLVAKPAGRFDLHPRVMEETVASVLGSTGWQSTVQGRSCDGGIDVVLQRGSERIAVQVKRTKNTIAVELVRAFTGALVAAGFTKGIFVTTSTFSKAAQRHVREVSPAYLIELMDARRFMEQLMLAERPHYVSLEDLVQEQGLWSIDFANADSDPIFTKYFKVGMSAGVIEMGYRALPP